MTDTERLITMPLIIELVGSWLWVSGQTYTCAPQLREYGLQFSKSKKNVVLVFRRYEQKKDAHLKNLTTK